MSASLSPLSAENPSAIRSASGDLALRTQASSRERKRKVTKSLNPDEYAKAVRAYSRLKTGAGQNHIALGEYLTSDPTPIFYSPSLKEDSDCVVLYSLDSQDVTSPTLSPPSPSLSPQRPAISDTDPDSGDESHGRHKIQNSTTFHDANEFFSSTKSQASSMIFLRGYMSAAWINNIGARFVVDPEYFCRHFDFRPPDDNSNNFSIPALPSSSWYLIELPVITIGSRTASKGPLRLDKITELRKQGAEALIDHHHCISKLSSSEMSVGTSMVRDFFVFDETHFAIEQRISICMQPTKDNKAFTLLVWLDSGIDQLSYAPPPWAVQEPESFYLPVILHRHMIALKSHLFSDATVQFSSLSTEYGRSLRPKIMGNDAFYSLTEIFNFAASSQMEFLNLIDVKLEKYTSLPSKQDFQSLPNLKYMKQILDRYIQKTQRVIHSIKNAQREKWPKDKSQAGKRKTAAAAENVEQDFFHLLDRAKILHGRTTEAITVLMSSISISESQRAITQAERMGKLTFLAFVFVPLSFTTAFFAMNFTYIRWWLAASLPLTGIAVATFFFDMSVPMNYIWAFCKTQWDRIEIGNS